MLNKKNVALLGAMAAAAMASTGAQAATENATAEVDIIAAVQLQQTNGLDFGVIAPGAVAGTVAIPATSNARTCVQVTCVGTPSRGRFTVTGSSGGYPILITVPPSVSLTSTAGSPMLVTLVSSTTTLNSSATAQEFFVGGVLHVGSNQAAGAYTGSYVVTADYQ